MVAPGNDYKIMEGEERQFITLCCNNAALLADASYLVALQVILDKYTITKASLVTAVQDKDNAFFEKILVKNADQPPPTDGQ